MNGIQVSLVGDVWYVCDVSQVPKASKHRCNGCDNPGRLASHRARLPVQGRVQSKFRTIPPCECDMIRQSADRRDFRSLFCLKSPCGRWQVGSLFRAHPQWHLGSLSLLTRPDLTPVGPTAFGERERGHWPEVRVSRVAFTVGLANSYAARGRGPSHSRVKHPASGRRGGLGLPFRPYVWQIALLARLPRRMR